MTTKLKSSVPNYTASTNIGVMKSRTSKMNFTSKAPDKPGFYVHRYRPDGEIAVYEFTTSDSFRGPTFGEWCLLLPADSLATSIEEAFREGFKTGQDVGIKAYPTGSAPPIDKAWLTSNARKKLKISFDNK